MQKKYRKYTMRLNGISLIITIVFGLNIFGYNNAHGTSIVSVPTYIIKRADLKVSSFAVTQGACYGGSLYPGYRYVNFSYIISNIGNKISPHYYVVVSNQSGLVIGTSSDLVLQTGASESGYMEILNLPGQHLFKITVYPLSSAYIPGEGLSFLDYADWSLDLNNSNNVQYRKAFINPCN